MWLMQSACQKGICFVAHSKEETFVLLTRCHILKEFVEHSDDDGEQISFYPCGWDKVDTQCSGQQRSRHSYTWTLRCQQTFKRIQATETSCAASFLFPTTLFPLTLTLKKKKKEMILYQSMKNNRAKLEGQIASSKQIKSSSWNQFQEMELNIQEMEGKSKLLCSLDWILKESSCPELVAKCLWNPLPLMVLLQTGDQMPKHFLVYSDKFRYVGQRSLLVC